MPEAAGRIRVRPRFRPFLWGEAATKRFPVCYGGSGSGKSHSTAQRIVTLALKYSSAGIIILVVRKTMPELKRTCLPLILSIIKELEISHIENQVDHTITIGKSKIFFISMDEAEKFKSFESDVSWVEETTEITEAEFRTIRNVTRHKGPVLNQVYMSFNPIDQFHWTIRKFVQGDNPDAAIMHSTYKDNLTHLPLEYIRELEGYEKEDENFYRVYTLGLPGVLKGLIYSNWGIMERSAWPASIKESPPHSYSIDFGMNNQTAMAAYWRYEKEDYLHEILYQTGMTNQDLIAFLNSNNISKSIPIFCDPAEKNRIVEIQREGYAATPADNSVKDGIDYCKSRKFYWTPESINGIAETRSYKYKEIKFQGEVRVLDEPVKIRDHLCDVQRYNRYSMRDRGSGNGVDLVAEMEGVLYPQKLDQW